MIRRCVCGEDISELSSHSFRCKKCQRDYNNFKRREKRAKEKEGIIRICEQCNETDISDRHPRALICWNCRRKNAAKANHNYWLEHREEHRKAQQKYYDKNKKKISKAKKQILNMELPENDGHRDVWMKWDNIPQCEGIALDFNSAKNTFGNKCKLRARYRLVDKYDKTVRYVCRLHIKTVGSLEWYRIEQLEHNTVIRKGTLFKWKKMQKKERERKIKKRNEKRKNRKKEPIGIYYNAHYPILGGNHRDQMPPPSNNNIGDK